MGAESRAVEIARGRRGIVLLDELLAAGLAKDAIRRRVETGWLTRWHAGVYSIGPLGPVGRIQAALIACGEGAMAWTYSAAALHRLLPFADAVHVATRRDGPRPKGVVTSRPRTLPDWTRREGLMTATVTETLLSLAARSPDDAQRAYDRAHIDRRITTASLTSFLIAKGSRRGVRALREIAGGPHTRSDAERIFWKLLKAARLQLPLVNVRVNGHLVDFYWPEHDLIVETDGWASHGRRGQWEQDRRRDLDHFASGVTVLRMTARQLSDEPLAVVAALTRRLEASAPRRGTAAS